MALGKVEKTHTGENLAALDRAGLANVPAEFVAEDGHPAIDYISPDADPAKPTRFLMLHLVVAGWTGLRDDEELVIDLNNGQIDTFKSDDGADIWTRPIKDKSATVTLRKINGQDEPLRSRVGLVEVGIGDVDIFNPNGIPPYVPPADPTDREQTDNFGFNTNFGVQWDDVDLSAEPGDSAFRKIARCVGLFVYMRPLLDDELGDVQRIGHASGVMMDGGVFLTAGHTVRAYYDPPGPDDTLKLIPFAEAHSGSISLNYEVNTGEEVKFYKVIDLIKHGYMYDGSDPLSDVDYAALAVKPPDDPEAQPLPSLPIMPPGTDFNANDPIMIIHHPAGLPKKISRPKANHPSLIFFPTDVQDLHHNLSWYFSADAVGGTSGAPLFPLDDNHIAGLVTDIVTPWEEGINDSGNYGPRISTIITHLRHKSIAEQNVKIALVVDTSGSMQALSGNLNDTNHTKLQDAKEALEAFVGLLVADGSHEIALIEFNATATIPRPMTVYDGVNLTERMLVDEINALVAIPRDTTSIGAGLDQALDQLDLGENPPQKVRVYHILLLTDGMDNKPEALEAVRQRLRTSPAQLNIIGFGQSGAIEHQQMSQLAYEFRGYYTYAHDGLELKKYFALIYSRIFEAGSPIDPTGVLRPGERDSEPVQFSVWDEQSLTVIAGWDRYDSTFDLVLTDPNGSEGDPQPGGNTTGNTWARIRLEKPLNGTWSAHIRRRDDDDSRWLRLRAHNAPVTCVAYLRGADDRAPYFAASGAANGAVYLWDVSRANVIQQYYVNEAYHARVADLGFYNDGNWICVAYASQPLIIWEGPTGVQLDRYISADQEQFRCLDISQQLGLLAVGGPQGFELLNLNTSPLQKVSFFPEFDVWALVFSPDDGLLAMGGGERNPVILLFDPLEPEEPLADLPVEEPVTCLAFSPDGVWLVAGHPSGRLSLYRRNEEGTYDLLEGGIKGQHGAAVTSLVFTPDGTFLFSSSLAYQEGDAPLITQWVVNEWIPIRELAGHTDSVLMLAVSRDGQQMLSASVDKTLLPWSIDGDAVKPLLAVAEFDERFFISTSAQADVHMTPYFRRTNTYYYTGDTYYPQVILRRRLGALLTPAKVELVITAPLESPGNLLVDAEYPIPTLEEEYGPAILGDRLTPESAALWFLQQRSPEPLIAYETTPPYPLFDDGQHYDGASEPDGLFGNPLPDVLLHEGHYQLRATARYGDEFQGSREVAWAIYVHIGIDAERTRVVSSDPVTGSSGETTVDITFTPCDRFGNRMGPGQRDMLIPRAPDGARLLGGLIDYGNGDYRQTVAWAAKTADVRGIYVAQPNRNAVWIGLDPEPVRITIPGGGDIHPPRPVWWRERLKAMTFGINKLVNRWIQRRRSRRK